jgi:two-component system sensor histidine kinase UhpB
MKAALNFGRHSVQAIAGGAPDAAALTRFLGSLDANPHLRAAMIRGGQEIAASHPAPPPMQAPAWFTRLTFSDVGPVDIPVAGYTVRLTALPASEIAERWVETRGLIGLLAFFSVLAAGLCFVVTAWSLRPLVALGAAFGRLERGEAALAVAEVGPPEIARLSGAFNQMQQALLAADQENRRLAAQLARLAEEERAELARDLHDEMGPLLFAITAWAAAARMQAQGGDPVAADASVAALEKAAAELQAALRDLLRRLRDSAPAPIDLRLSLEELVAFWRGVRPQTDFALSIEGAPDVAAEPARAALFRVAQEGISNAVRHGDAAHIEIDLAPAAGGLRLRVGDDGRGGDGGDGFGLVGMQERLQAVGGHLRITRQKGWQLTAWAPAEPPA